MEDVNTSMPEIFMSEVTDLPFYHVILASEDIFGRLFLGSRTLRVAKSMWQRPCCCTSLGIQTNLANIICYFHLIDFDLLDYVQRTVLMRQEGAIQQVHTQLDESEGSSNSYSWVFEERGITPHG